MNIFRCPSCLKKGFNEFCPDCRKSLFNGRKISPVLSFSRPDYNRRKLEKAGRISISGVQSKHSLALTGAGLELVEKGGEYILKPIPPGEFENLDAMPANEHVTMQMARQVFGLNTAQCALVFFSRDSAPAYLTKRFDVFPDGTRRLQEDFAQIAQVSEESHGKNYKYDFSYEKIAALLKKHISSYAVEVEKFFRLVLFNYLTHNGDAHLKNFSVYRDQGMNTYLLAPAYDLLNTRLHLPFETPLALDLFESGYETESYKANGYFAYDDFFEFGARLGIPPKRVERFIAGTAGRGKEINELLARSFLDDSLQTK
ncbi:MAG: HipA domain-containing protein [Chitinivibrionales bacterium]|nr:HipA domain-containing protein [Chitinivibrionales bacterium]